MISKIIINHDKLIDKLFFKEEKYYIKNVSKYNINKNKKYNNIKQYIQNRYLDSSSDRETIYRIHYNIENKPLCPVCGKELQFYGRKNVLFLSHCSNKCKKLDSSVNNKWKISCGDLGTNREKAKQTMQEKYGVSNPFQMPEIIEKIKQINKEKYHESSIKKKQTRLKK